MATIKSAYGAPAKARRLVWRITERAPLGAWVVLDAKPEPSALGSSLIELPEVSTNGGWLVSSFDLLNGTDVQEVEDTIPGDLFDEMFPPAGSAPKKPGR
jgi:hypothetical protein